MSREEKVGGRKSCEEKLETFATFLKIRNFSPATKNLQILGDVIYV